MAVYTVHQPPLKKDEAAPDPERFAFVRDGFSFWAFLFGPLWMLRHRMWLVLLGYVAVAVAHACRACGCVGASGGGALFAGFMLRASGRHGGGHAAALDARRGAAGAISASSSATIARRPSGGSSIHGCAARRSRRLPRARRAPAAPAQRRRRSAAPDVIGLFPQPGAPR